MKYFIQIQYRTINGIATRFTTVEAESKQQAKKLLFLEIHKDEIVELTINEIEKNSFKNR